MIGLDILKRHYFESAGSAKARKQASSRVNLWVIGRSHIRKEVLYSKSSKLKQGGDRPATPEVMEPVWAGKVWEFTNLGEANDLLIVRARQRFSLTQYNNSILH